jgi:cysteine-S-conjugate beta-lyase
MTSRFDEIPVETLRELGSVKWTQFPGKVGAFIAEMDFGTAPAVTRALHDAVDAAAFGYLPQALVEQMSQAYAAWSRSRYGWDVPPANVRPLADVVAGLVAAIEHFSRPGSPVILPTPAYMPFLVVPGTLGREIIQVPMGGGPEGLGGGSFMVPSGGRLGYDLDALEAAFQAGGHLLVLCNPHNPIGRVLSRAELTAVAEVVERNGGRVFADEIHAPLVYPGHRHVPYASISPVTAGHTVTATSASKAWNLPGLKCAQLVLSNDADIETWSRVGFMAEHGAATLGVVANTAAYAAGGEWLDELIAYLDGSRALLGELLAEHLPKVGYAQPEGTYLAWLDCRALDLDGAPAQFFRDRAGVAMTDGAMCGVAGEGFVRYTFATPRPIMRHSVEQMARSLAGR